MNKLAYYLRRTPAKEVYVDLDKVAELIGEDKAVELSIFCIKKSESRKGRLSKRSAIPTNKRLDVQHTAGFNRVKLLEAIEEAQGATFQVDGTEPVKMYSAFPNESLLPEKQKKALKARGILS
jgi:hypothetical protein